MGDRYITNVALSFIGELKIEWQEAKPFDHSFSAQSLYERRNIDVRLKVCHMKPETLGKICAQGLAKDAPRTEQKITSQGVTEAGKTSLYAVHCGVYLSKYDSGRDLLIELATTTIIAEMADILRKKMHAEIARDLQGYEGVLS